MIDEEQEKLDVAHLTAEHAANKAKFCASCAFPTAAEALARQVKALKARAEKAEANYQWMVNRAADEKLDGYRALGARAAEAENQADQLRAHVEKLHGLIRTALAWGVNGSEGYDALTAFDTAAALRAAIAEKKEGDR